MRAYFLLMSLATLTLLSCKKTMSDPGPVAIEGTWQMILVKDNQSNVPMVKPPLIAGDVIISFVLTEPTKGSFSGKTPTNTIWSNSFSIGPDQTISMPVLSMTKVAETEWGNHFVNKITTAQQYSFETSVKLSIITAGKTLTFKKI